MKTVRPRWYRMSCGCLYQGKAPYAQEGNALYCERHLGERRRVRMLCVITICHRCGRGMVLAPKSSRTKYCRHCNNDVQRRQNRERMRLIRGSKPGPPPAVAKVEKPFIDPQIPWMRPSDYFKARYEGGFPLPDHVFERNLVELKMNRYSYAMAEESGDEVPMLLELFG